MDNKDLLKYIDEQNILYTYIEHPPVYTCEEADRYTGHYPGVGTKNLFLSNHKSDRYYILMTLTALKINFKSLQKMLMQKKLKLSSLEDTREYLGIEPGAVSIFSIVNDKSKQVEVILDERLYGYKLVQTHPLINTTTLIISMKNIELFLYTFGIRYQILKIPAV